MTSNRFRTVLTCVLLAWPIAFATADDPQPTSRPATRPATQPATRPAVLSAAQLAQFEKLIEQMRDSSFEKREAADAKIRKMGALALPVIRKYIDDDDPEVAQRAEQIATFIDLQIPVRADQIDARLVFKENTVRGRRRLGLTVFLTNKTAKPTLMAGTIGYGYVHPSGYFVVTGPDGKEIPPQSPGQTAIPRNRMPRVLAGHQPYVRSFNLAVRPGVRKGPNAATRLQLHDRNTFFPLPVPGEYTIRLRIDGKYVANAAKQAIDKKVKPSHGNAIPLEGVLGFTGVIESNAVTFEIKK